MCRRVRLTAKLGLGALGIELFVRDKVAIRILYHKPASTLPQDARPLRYETWMNAFAIYRLSGGVWGDARSFPVTTVGRQESLRSGSDNPFH